MQNKKAKILTVLLFLLPFLLTLASLSIGRFHIPPKDLGRTIIQAISPKAGPTNTNTQRCRRPPCS